jgi:hypothetical protein
VLAQEQDSTAGCEPCEVLSDLQAVEVGKTDIEENQVWLKVLGEREGLRTVGSLANDLKARVCREDR